MVTEIERAVIGLTVMIRTVTKSQGVEALYCDCIIIIIVISWRLLVLWSQCQWDKVVRLLRLSVLTL